MADDRWKAWARKTVRGRLDIERERFWERRTGWQDAVAAAAVQLERTGRLLPRDIRLTDEKLAQITRGYDGVLHESADKFDGGRRRAALLASITNRVIDGRVEHDRTVSLSTLRAVLTEQHVLGGLGSVPLDVATHVADRHLYRAGRERPDPERIEAFFDNLFGLCLLYLPIVAAMDAMVRETLRGPVALPVGDGLALGYLRIVAPVRGHGVDYNEILVATALGSEVHQGKLPLARKDGAMVVVDLRTFVEDSWLSHGQRRLRDALADYRRTRAEALHDAFQAVFLGPGQDSAEHTVKLIHEVGEGLRDIVSGGLWSRHVREDGQTPPVC